MKAAHWVPEKFIDEVIKEGLKPIKGECTENFKRHHKDTPHICCTWHPSEDEELRMIGHWATIISSYHEGDKMYLLEFDLDGLNWEQKIVSINEDEIAAYDKVPAERLNVLEVWDPQEEPKRYRDQDGWDGTYGEGPTEYQKNNPYLEG